MNKKIFIKLIVSLVLIVILLKSVNISEFFRSFQNANLMILILAFSIAIPGILISTYKWKIFLNVHGIINVSFLRLWKLYHIGMFFNNFLPTDVGGDVVRSYDVGKLSNKQAESLAAVFMERITGIMAVIIYGIIGVFLNWSMAANLKLTYLGFGGFIFSAICLCLLFHEGFAAWIKRKLEFRAINKLVNKINSFYLSLIYYKKDIKILLHTMTISMIFQCLAIFYVYLLIISLDLACSFIQLLLIVPMITLIGIIPITINGIGLREGAFVFLFAKIGISPSESFALSLLYRIGSLIPSILGGFLYGIGDFYVTTDKKMI